MNNGYFKLFAGCLIAALFLYAIQPLWLATVLSVFLYLLLEPFQARLMAQGVPRTRAILMTLAVPMLLLVYGISYAFSAASLYLPDLAADLAHLQGSATDALERMDGQIERALNLQLHLADFVSELNPEKLAINEQVLASTGVAANLLLNVLLVPLLAFFMLRDYRQLRDRLLALIPNSQFELGWLIYHRVSIRMQAYLRGLFLQQLILASITGTGFWLLGFPSPVLLGILTGVAGLIPYLGPLLALVAPVVLLLTNGMFDLDGLFNAVLVLAVGFGFDNLVVIPFLIAGSVNLHPAIALTAVIIAGHLGGIPAMILVIPVLGMVRIVVESVYRGLQPADRARLRQP